MALGTTNKLKQFDLLISSCSLAIVDVTDRSKTIPSMPSFPLVLVDNSFIGDIHNSTTRVTPPMVFHSVESLSISGLYPVGR